MPLLRLALALAAFAGALLLTSTPAHAVAPYGHVRQTG